MAARARRVSRPEAIWPGFVDALSTLLMVIIFLLVVFMLAQYFLSVALSGRDEALDRLNHQVSELASLLSLERQANAELRLDIAQLSSELQSSTAARDRLSSDLTSVISERDALDARLAAMTDQAARTAADAEALRAALAEANQMLEADRETLEIRLAELASLRRDIATLRQVRSELEAQVSQLATTLVETATALDETTATLDITATELAETTTTLDETATALAETTSALDETTSALEETAASLDESRAAATVMRAELTARRDRTMELEARLSDEEERTALAQKEIDDREIRLNELRLALRQSDEELTAEQALSNEARARIELLNQQIIALRQQLTRLSEALEIAETEAREQGVVISDLGRKLNLALAGKVEELQRYRSEFFGRLREVLGNRAGIRIVDDRFVLQSEVLFASGSAIIEDAGREQMARIAATLLEISREIPDDLPWILRVDGHTDRIPIFNEQFPSNWELSTARAISVVRFLVDQGVPPERLVAAGFGEFQPIDPSDDEIALRRNRRIELKLTSR